MPRNSSTRCFDLNADAERAYTCGKDILQTSVACGLATNILKKAMNHVISVDIEFDFLYGHRKIGDRALGGKK
jgi:hypothetical protein